MSPDGPPPGRPKELPRNRDLLRPQNATPGCCCRCSDSVSKLKHEVQP